jgi:hypothetical protein
MNPELLGRLALIEKMVAEGRRSTARRGWLFLLWGAGPLLAILWTSIRPFSVWAWPVVLAICVLIHGMVARFRSRRGESKTASMHAVGAVWTCTGVTVLLLALCAAWSGTLEARALYVIFFALASVAHGTSSLILRWLPQFLAALVWWLASIAAFFVPIAHLRLIAIAALILGNLVFGAWLVYCERSLEGD